MIALCIWISLLLPYVWGNTEKTIFLGPSPVDIQSTYPQLNTLQLGPLNPDNFTIRTHLHAIFPNEFRDGEPSWFILHNLTEGQRYEVRVCWAATQPTAFRLETYELETVFTIPELHAELYESKLSLKPVSWQTYEPGIKDSVLFLRILAAADFYTTNHTLMKDVPPVFVDIILDPFILNVLPRSLLPTVAYIIVVAIVSWFVGSWISSRVRQTTAEPEQEKKYQ
ncbi:hypothetical protein HD806DRAFT_514752 [Xylariaceae sp. AK1471]|nr:hypothetical protein HD806DRAFT_514752 [Xylariaceae sp. AK1471]